MVGWLAGVPKQRTDPFTQRKELKSTSIRHLFRERGCEKPDLGWTRTDGGWGFYFTTRERKLVQQAKPSRSRASAEGGYSAIFREPEFSKKKKKEGEEGPSVLLVYSNCHGSDNCDGARKQSALALLVCTTLLL